MKHLLIITASVIGVATTAAAQTAKQVLDKAAKTLEVACTAQSDFSITSFAGNVEQNVTRGNIEIKGRSFHLATDDMQTWYDGQTQWTILGNSNEVNITEPTEEEQARMNPYAFIALYKKGYNMKLKQAKLRGIQTYEVTLTAKKKTADLPVIIINLDPSNHHPMCIRLKHDNDWVRISMQNLRLGQKMDDSKFTFPKSQYPNIELIDLR